MKVLGIETSCDDTAAAVIQDHDNPQSRVLSSIISSQFAEHAPHGGIVPEIAARTHLSNIHDVISRAIKNANTTLKDISYVAVTTGPGLAGSLIIGSVTAQALAMGLKKIVIPINHLAGHALSVRLTNEVHFPYLALLVSGGHCQFILVYSAISFRVIGQTLDDAAGEAFDKVAKMLKLDWPGGPKIEQMAKKGREDSYLLPLPLKHRKTADMSFSGIKTAARQIIEKSNIDNVQTIYDLAASFQKSVTHHLCHKARIAMTHIPDNCRHFVVVGGVASNQYIRTHLQNLCDQKGLIFSAPPADLCTDNAAMIAWAAIEQIKIGSQISTDFSIRPRWPLSSDLYNNIKQ